MIVVVMSALVIFGSQSSVSVMANRFKNSLFRLNRTKLLTGTNRMNPDQASDFSSDTAEPSRLDRIIKRDVIRYPSRSKNSSQPVKAEVLWLGPEFPDQLPSEVIHPPAKSGTQKLSPTPIIAQPMYLLNLIPGALLALKLLS